MKKYENIVKQQDDRGPSDLTRQIGELQCENEGLKNKVHDAELETSLIKAVGMNSPEMKAAKAEINTLKETLKSRDYTRQHDYQFLLDQLNKNPIYQNYHQRSLQKYYHQYANLWSPLFD